MKKCENCGSANIIDGRIAPVRVASGSRLQRLAGNRFIPAGQSTVGAEFNIVALACKDCGSLFNLRINPEAFKQ